jgi:hypothetical protein
MDFKEKTELINIRNGEDRSESVFGLLIGKERVAEYYGDIDQYGRWANKLYPAWYKGERCWLESGQWAPNEGYCAEMRNQRILTFQEGVKILMKQGCFKHLWE